jgi:hypothetical protein
MEIADMSTANPVTKSAGSVVVLVFAWLAVALPLLWGVVLTFSKALALFR